MRITAKIIIDTSAKVESALKLRRLAYNGKWRRPPSAAGRHNSMKKLKWIRGCDETLSLKSDSRSFAVTSPIANAVNRKQVQLRIRAMCSLHKPLPNTLLWDSTVTGIQQLRIQIQRWVAQRSCDRIVPRHWLNIDDATCVLLHVCNEVKHWVWRHLYNKIAHRRISTWQNLCSQNRTNFQRQTWCCCSVIFSNALHARFSYIPHALHSRGTLFHLHHGILKQWPSKGDDRRRAARDKAAYPE